MCGRGRRTLPITPTRPRVITGPETGPLGHVNTVNTGRWVSLSLSIARSNIFVGLRLKQREREFQRVESDGGGFFFFNIDHVFFFFSFFNEIG